MKNVLTKDELNKIDAYFRASNYLSVGQLYLLDNPLLKKKLEFSDVKKKLVGHWGTVPGQNFIYTHLNRIINKYDLNMIYISGPGHGGNAMVAQAYMEKTYSEVYPNITYDESGMQKLFKQFSFPKGISSHVAPETPGSINEGGELGYSLAHAYGAVLDNKDLIVACVVGDGEAETGPLAASWHSNKMLNPETDGIVLPILHLNGYKIANPTILARISDKELDDLFKGYGYKPYYVNIGTVEQMHEDMACALEMVVKDIKKIKSKSTNERVIYPMIILRTKKGWTGPVKVDDKEIEGTFNAHQIPIVVTSDNPDSLKQLEEWLKSYKPNELFDENGVLISELQELSPKGSKRMSANPVANGGLLLKDLIVPDFRKYAVNFDKPGEIMAQDTMELGKFVRDVVVLNKGNFKVFGPDETKSNRLTAVFEKTDRQFNGEIYGNDEFIGRSGAVLDTMLSEHLCQGWLEGYLLTGRHGFFNSYEAFIRIVDSMASQHAKWLKVTRELSWRKEISSLNYLLSSHVWQQDHNGYTHQDPGFLNHLVTKKADIVRAYLPPDANCLLSCFDHCIRSKNYINVVIASKHPTYQWLTMDEAVKHCTKGIGVWDFASNDHGYEPDIVMACCGDTPTLETLAAVKILREFYKDLKIRVVNVVDLMKLESHNKHPHGLTDFEYNNLFTKDKHIIFNFHGYPNLIHQLTYNRKNKKLHVHGYNEEGTITTPFDMRVQNKIDRFNLVKSALKYLDKLGDSRTSVIEYCNNKLIEHNIYIKEYGIDMPEILNWKWDNEETDE